jgi:hypothetical protein
VRGDKGEGGDKGDKEDKGEGGDKGDKEDKGEGEDKGEKYLQVFPIPIHQSPYVPWTGYANTIHQSPIPSSW